MCILPCGINEEVMNGKCQCKMGFGRYDDKCDRCPSNFFINDGFCVSCPIASTLDPATGICVCDNGLQLDPNGFCVEKC